jgi:hypothetical protein
MGLGGVVTSASPAGAGAASPHALAPRAVAVTSTTPAYGGDAADPDVIESGSVFYAFTTGTALGNNLQALVNTTGNPTSGWGSYTGHSYGSSALPSPPAWETPNTATSPGVFQYGGHWVMFYDAAVNPNAADSGHNCLSVATAASLSPTNAAFTDTSGGPLYCATGGVLDPSPYVDPATGAAYLLWKTNDGGSAVPSQVWAVRLNAAGTGFAGSPTMLITVNQTQVPWETTFDDPQMVTNGGAYDLLFSAGNNPNAWESSAYSEGLTTCSGPLGPCSQPTSGPFLSTYGTVAGPAGGTLFKDTMGNWWIDYAAWIGPGGCYNYGCGSIRELFVAPFSFTSTPPAPATPRAVGMAPSPAGGGYWIAYNTGDLYGFGTSKSYGSPASKGLNAPLVGLAPTSSGVGYWLVGQDGGIFSYGDAKFYGSTGNLHLNKPVVGMTSSADSHGYWFVASDGGIFSYGDAKFFGSTGNLHLNQPVVGMASTPSGHGYWLVASDGGIFSYGDAKFYGSTGNIHLNKPVVGMTSTPDGKGYWFVASDGGIFSYGDAKFYGSTGNIHLNQPVVGMASTPTGHGYWLVAADGGIFSYGDAKFYGTKA